MESAKQVVDNPFGPEQFLAQADGATFAVLGILALMSLIRALNSLAAASLLKDAT